MEKLFKVGYLQDQEGEINMNLMEVGLGSSTGNVSIRS
jgi:hypothetical protein